ncbi:MAG: methylmalonyl-CoA mutase [Porticoccus sp.]|nr:methylmalonyl-CoA mutase [Porticoccus sp.]
MKNLTTKIKDKKNHKPLRFLTATSLFDGHDAAINVIRRLIQSKGAEVVHLGHNRSVCEVVRAAIQEDVDGIAISSYQGGHMEYFTYLLELLKENSAEHIKVFGGGGGTISLEEIKLLESAGVSRIYHPEQGMEMGLVGMIDDLFQIVRSGVKEERASIHQTDHLNLYSKVDIDDEIIISEAISAIENRNIPADSFKKLKNKWKKSALERPVIGITGTGGAGKSSVVDELLERFLRNRPDIRIAVLAVDPTRRKTGGALLGDRIRMNSLSSPNIFMRSMATRRQHLATNEVLGDITLFLGSIGYDLILVETAGIGQSDSQIIDIVDLSVYVMTSDYGAATQLEKIDMVDYADLVILNKFEKRGSEDALRDIRKQWRRNHNAFDPLDIDIPVCPAVANQFNDPGLSHAFYNLCKLITQKKRLDEKIWVPEGADDFIYSKPDVLIPENRARYLSEISENGRQIFAKNKAQVELASEAHHAYSMLKKIKDKMLPDPLERYLESQLTQSNSDKTLIKLRATYQDAVNKITDDSKKLIKKWKKKKSAVESEKYSYSVRDRVIEGDNFLTSLSQLKIPKVAAPQYRDWGEVLNFLLSENLPGDYPYTAGVFSYRRSGEDPSRMFAGEGTPEKTNCRFHHLSSDLPAIRLSTAFDSVTLYGADPDVRPDIWGKIGNSGVSIATLDDMKKLYSGFNLCSSKTSVSMTINGPAPMILAFFMNTVIDQQVEIYLKEKNLWSEAELKIRNFFKGKKRPTYKGKLPEGHNGLGLAMLGITGDKLVENKVYSKIKAAALSSVRGTVQADILKEDQAQNTCIFSTNFAMRLMGDVQEYFIENKISNYYSVSVSGYHIAEAGANPISQLAFTLSNGFTLVEYYLSRGMKIDDFVSNFSFFFSNGMDPEYAVMGRVARRIWARAMKERYDANPRSQMLKYHIQTSGRSLHAQEMSFNDIRTTLQALYAIFDNTNSLHTNAYDEAITTPTSESVRRAMAIQLIINREFGLNFCENPWQGSFIVEQLTDLVEEAVYKEFDRISERGGVLGAMDTMYQRGKIQEESMIYEHKKHDGSLPLIGINTFLPSQEEREIIEGRELARSDSIEKQLQVDVLKAYTRLNKVTADKSISDLQKAALNQENTFSYLMEAAKYNSLGQLSSALYNIGGLYRRNM